MREDKYREGCTSCKYSQGKEKPFGDIVVSLDDKWTLNHYGGREGFLGWLVLQPRFDRMDMSELNQKELKPLGRHIQRIDQALRDWWNSRNAQLDDKSKDYVERVYIVYFFESFFDSTHCTHHMHIHLIPRTKRMVGRWAPSQVAAWRIYELSRQHWFPKEYQICKNGKVETTKKVDDLMAYLQSHI